MLTALAALAATPTPASTPDESIVTPGPLGFAAVAFVAVAVFLLVWDMLRRIRRGRYREEVNAELDAEEQARAAEAASETDDEDIDRDAPRS
ncbi:hypothetical protein [Microbacterium sp. T32]|uniref:hypothetical protein n=1 Tax=Microbacterium sp. T32 TaxID=1776083 RepID=UPI0007AB29D2|nr:hypothetical protein [Microbacterium sp. T32]KZE41223.1 hypothetical protein AVW09_01100 [Microbacterium sp. T32]